MNAPESQQRITVWMSQLSTVPEQLQDVVHRELSLEKPNHALVQKTLQSMAKVLTDLIKLESRRQPEESPARTQQSEVGALSSAPTEAPPEAVSQASEADSQRPGVPAESAKPHRVPDIVWRRIAQAKSSGQSYKPTKAELRGEAYPPPLPGCPD